jgi:uncharacterized iron-regulated membrane protein
MDHALLLKIHRWFAAAIGIFIVVMGVTGSILGLQENLDAFFHPHLSYVTPQSHPLTLSEISTAVSNKFPQEPIVAFMPSPDPNHSWLVALPAGIAYVNPYSGEVLGLRERGETFFGVIRALHVQLAAGALGKNVVRGVDVGTIFLLLSGVCLWWPAKRIRIRNLDVTRASWFDLHNTVGITSLVFLAALTITGAIIGFQDFRSISMPSGVKPFQPISTGDEAPHPQGKPITPDQAVTIAQLALPDTFPSRIQMPAYGGVYRISLTQTKHRTANANDLAAIDPHGGQILFINRARDVSRTDWMLAANEAIHTGAILGTSGRFVMSFASMMLLVLAVSGTFMWYMHPKKKFIKRGT